MATLTIHPDRIIGNIKKLSDYLDKNNITWTLVTKMLNGYKPVLERILCDPEIKRLHSVGDARISNLKAIKEIKPDIVTIYIKPPAPNIVKSIVKYADISINSNIATLEAINKECEATGKKHRAVIMIEMGELREGILRENVLRFYERSFNLEHMEIIGIGTNLGCMYGIEPTYDKLVQLALYKQLIEVKFGKALPIISGGSSITLPLIKMKKIPKEINHFRIGESAFLGVSPFDNKKFRNLSTNCFDFSGEIVEMEKKAKLPDGTIGDGNIGTTPDIDENDDASYEHSYRAILDFGAIDVDVNNLWNKDRSISFAGTTSDMTVYDLGEKSNKYKVGNKIHFFPNYMAVARLTNSKYISKEIK